MGRLRAHVARSPPGLLPKTIGPPRRAGYRAETRALNISPCFSLFIIKYWNRLPALSKRSRPCLYAARPHDGLGKRSSACVAYRRHKNNSQILWISLCVTVKTKSIQPILPCRYLSRLKNNQRAACGSAQAQIGSPAATSPLPITSA